MVQLIESDKENKEMGMLKSIRKREHGQSRVVSEKVDLTEKNLLLTLIFAKFLKHFNTNIGYDMKDINVFQYFYEIK